MAKLYFSYSAMNAGKSTILLQAAHNYVERGMKTLLLTAELDNRYEKGKISSRIGFESFANDALIGPKVGSSGFATSSSISFSIFDNFI